MPKNKPIAPKAVLKLPPPWPRPVTVPLEHLIDYMKFHNIKGTGYIPGQNMLIVKKVENDGSEPSVEPLPQTHGSTLERHNPQSG